MHAKQLHNRFHVPTSSCPSVSSLKHLHTDVHCITLEIRTLIIQCCDRPAHKTFTLVLYTCHNRLMFASRRDISTVYLHSTLLDQSEQIHLAKVDAVLSSCQWWWPSRQTQGRQRQVSCILKKLQNTLLTES